MNAPRLVLYDGTCGFCDAAVRWLLELDKEGLFTFAPLQGETARAIRAAHPELPESSETILYLVRSVDGEQLFWRSEAVFHILAEIPSRWRWLSRARVLPRFLTDLGYRIFASLRYPIFGRLDTCRIPSPEVRARFLP